MWFIRKHSVAAHKLTERSMTTAKKQHQLISLTRAIRGLTLNEFRCLGVVFAIVCKIVAYSSPTSCNRNKVTLQVMTFDGSRHLTHIQRSPVVVICVKYGTKVANGCSRVSSSNSCNSSFSLFMTLSIIIYRNRFKSSKYCFNKIFQVFSAYVNVRRYRIFTSRVARPLFRPCLNRIYSASTIH